MTGSVLDGESAPRTKPIDNPELGDLLRRYVELFNRQDWDGVRELTSADARLRVTECFAGRLVDSPYFIEYERPIIPWQWAMSTARRLSSFSATMRTG